VVSYQLICDHYQIFNIDIKFPKLGIDKIDILWYNLSNLLRILIEDTVFLILRIEFLTMNGGGSQCIPYRVGVQFVVRR